MTTATHPRTLRLPAPLWSTLLSAVAAERDPAEAIALLRQAGFDAGRGMHELLESHAASEGEERPLTALPPERFWELVASLFRALGWGTLEHRQPHPGVAELTGDDWAEADAARHGLGCQVTTGLLADLLTRIAGQDVAVLEVECRGRGGDRCRFLIGSPEVLRTLHGELREGHGADEAVERLG